MDTSESWLFEKTHQTTGKPDQGKREKELKATWIMDKDLLTVIIEMKKTFKWTLSHWEDHERECAGCHCWATLSTIFKGVLGRSPETGEDEKTLKKLMLHLVDYTSLFPYINSWMPTTLWCSKGSTHLPLCHRWGSKMGNILGLVSGHMANRWWHRGWGPGSSDSHPCHATWLPWHLAGSYWHDL